MTKEEIEQYIDLADGIDFPRHTRVDIGVHKRVG